MHAIVQEGVSFERDESINFTLTNGEARCRFKLPFPVLHDFARYPESDEDKRGDMQIYLDNEANIFLRAEALFRPGEEVQITRSMLGVPSIGG